MQVLRHASSQGGESSCICRAAASCHTRRAYRQPSSPSSTDAAAWPCAARSAAGPLTDVKIAGRRRRRNTQHGMQRATSTISGGGACRSVSSSSACEVASHVGSSPSVGSAPCACTTAPPHSLHCASPPSAAARATSALAAPGLGSPRPTSAPGLASSSAQLAVEGPCHAGWGCAKTTTATADAGTAQAARTQQ